MVDRGIESLKTVEKPSWPALPLTASSSIRLTRNPNYHWRYDSSTKLFDFVKGRRLAGYLVPTPGSKAFDNPGLFVEIPLVNQIRPGFRAWPEAGYPGVSSITERLLEHWQDPENFDRRRFFSCQLEAVETLIPPTEGSPVELAAIGT